MSEVNRKYKDSVFRLLFGSDRQELLGLYNAVNGTTYTDPNELIINTLEDAIYLGMKNDISFVIRDGLSLYEHQSTLNPNIPLRNLFYVSDLLQVMTADVNLYSEEQKKIATPHFVMFYNGVKKLKVLEYRLSDLFIIREEHPDLELVVRIININPGEDEGVLERCKTLREYAWFVETVRKHLRENGLAEALPQAVDECIAKGILRDFLIRHKAQVIKMSIYEFNQEQLRKWDQEEGLEKGRKEGDLFRLLTLIQRKIKKGKCLSQIADELEEEESVISREYEAVLAAGEDVSIDEIVQKLLTKA